MHDDEGRDEAVIRIIMSEVEPPPGRMGAADLLAAGRRARRRRRSTAATAGAFVLSLLAVGGVQLLDRDGPADPPALLGPAAMTSTTPPPPCTATPLELGPKATEGSVNAGSPSGRYLVGFTSFKGTIGSAVRWDGTKQQRLPVPGVLADPLAVNDSGLVVGRYQTGARTVAWAWTGSGDLIHLPIPAGYTGAEANAVNAAGDVAGVLFGRKGTVPVVWRGVNAKAWPEEVKAPGKALAFGISDAGVVVGTVEGEKGSVPYQWDAAGVGSPLALPDGTSAATVLGVRGDWAYGLLFPKPTDGADPSAVEQRKQAAALAQEKLQPYGPEATRGPGTAAGFPNPAATRQLGIAAVWDLRNGTAAVVTEGRIGVVNSRRWLVVNRPEGLAELRAPDNTSRELPGLRGKPDSYAAALSEDGGWIGGSSAGVPVRWNCP
ncbi:hypothetical protein AB0J86_23720 [Micromonospora sp. NPDC049559]|uniref:hypothetical protein n=1 Tax=Micromonospora sp. NPDC049559 TaxID=3155923 RepID=UPI00343008AD